MTAVTTRAPFAGPKPCTLEPKAPAAPAKETTTDEPEAVESAGTEDELAPLWRVICHDDPITTMDFVVEVLRTVFRLPAARAFELMMRVHQTGSAVIGKWPESTAKSRAERARNKARAAGFPLAFTVEKDV